MRGRKKTFSLALTDDQRAQLQRWQRCSTLPAGLVRRARLILLLDQGQSVTAAGSLTMNDLTSNQNTCKSVNLLLSFTA